MYYYLFIWPYNLVSRHFTDENHERYDIFEIYKINNNI